MLYTPLPHPCWLLNTPLTHSYWLLYTPLPYPYWSLKLRPLSVGALRDKEQLLGLNEYSRVVYRFLTLGQYLTQLWRVKGQISAIFSGNLSFSTLKANIYKTMKGSDTGLSPSCFPDTSLPNGMYFEASAPLLSPHIAWESDRSRLPPGGIGGRAAATALGSSLLPLPLWK